MFAFVFHQEPNLLQRKWVEKRSVYKCQLLDLTIMKPLTNICFFGLQCSLWLNTVTLEHFHPCLGLYSLPALCTCARSLEPHPTPKDLRAKI